MARDTLTPLTAAKNAAVTGFVQTSAYTAITAANGAQVAYPKDGKLIVHVKNTYAGSKAFTVKAGTGPLSSQGDLVVTLDAQNKESVLLFLESARFKQADGNIYIDFAASMTGYIAAFAIPN